MCPENHTSSTFEPFRYLSIPIPSNHMDRFELKVVFFPALSAPAERPRPQRLAVAVPKSSTAKRVQLALTRQLSVGRSSLLLAEVYRSRIHRYLEPNLPLSDVRSEDQIVAFEVPQTPQDLWDYKQRLLPGSPGRESPEDLSIPSSVQVLMIQAMHRRVVDVCRSDGRTWSQRREVFGLPFVMSRLPQA
ncbi:UBP9 [Symbiodinium pilosum]|uniref:UBP9 protein n=1 Tax=Symbiodinium pilosum TaxID=2952 RepID=A0A812JWD3_SYMPI|nr:UBP9 [Symbiodinium pilosum]